MGLLVAWASRGFVWGLLEMVEWVFWGVYKKTNVFVGGSSDVYLEV